MLKYMIVPAIAAIFVFGDSDAHIFAQVISWAILTVAVISIFGTKSKPDTRASFARWWARLCIAALIASMVYAGFPILASSWLIVVVLGYAKDLSDKEEQEVK